MTSQCLDTIFNSSSFSIQRSYPIKALKVLFVSALSNKLRNKKVSNDFLTVLFARYYLFVSTKTAKSVDITIRALICFVLLATPFSIFFSSTLQNGLKLKGSNNSPTASTSSTINKITDIQRQRQRHNKPKKGTKNINNKVLSRTNNKDVNMKLQLILSSLKYNSSDDLKPNSKSTVNIKERFKKLHKTAATNYFSRRQVATHCTDADCWIIVDDKVRSLDF